METPTYPLPPSLPVVTQPQGNDKIWSILSHLSSFIGLPFLLPIAVYFAFRRDSAYVTAHASEALNFHLSLLIYTIACVPLIFLAGLGALLIGGMWLASLVFAIIATVKASNGETYRYPLTIRMVS